MEAPFTPTLEAEDKVMALQGGYGIFAVKFWREVTLSLVSTKRWQ